MTIHTDVDLTQLSGSKPVNDIGDVNSGKLSSIAMDESTTSLKLLLLDSIPFRSFHSFLIYGAFCFGPFRSVPFCSDSFCFYTISNGFRFTVFHFIKLYIFFVMLNLRWTVRVKGEYLYPNLTFKCSFQIHSAY